MPGIRMDLFSGTTRRRYLGALFSGGIASGLAGCNSNADASDSTTTTVVFTDTTTENPTTATTTTSDTQVFDGGDIASFASAVRTASELETPLQIEPGTYTFDPMSAESTGPKRPHVEFSDLDGATIVGNDATIRLKEPRYGGIWFTDSRDVTIRDLTIDYDPVPYTQGAITTVSRADGTFTVTLDEGYPTLDHEMFSSVASVYGLVHDADGSFVDQYRTDRSSDKYFTDIEALEESRFRLHLDTRKSDFTAISTDHRLTIVARNNHAVIRCYNVTNPSMENVTVRTSNGGAFSMGISSAPTFDGCTIAPPPGSDRQLATVADGIRITNCLDGSIIENCRHERLGDDSIAVDNRMASVAGFESPDTITVDGTHPFVVSEGDQLEAMAPDGTIRADLPPIASYEERFSVDRERAKPTAITFEDGIDDRLSVGDYLANTAIASSGYRIRNNEFRNHRANLIRVNSHDGVIENNLLDGVDGYAIELHSGTRGHWPPKRWTSNVTVRNNTIRRAGMTYLASDTAAAIRLHHESPPDVPTAHRPNRNIVLRGNTIENSASVGIDVGDAEELTIEGNSMQALNQMGYQNGGFGVRLTNIHAAVVRNNTVRGAANRLTGFGLRQQSEDIESSGNTLVRDGDPTTGQIVSFEPVTVTFDRTVIPENSSRKLAFRCFSLALLDAGGDTIRAVSVGGDADGVRYGTGVYGSVQADGRSWRWFGGPQNTTTIYFFENELAAADTLQLRGYAIETPLSATISVNGSVTDELTWTSNETDTYTVSL